MAALIEGTNAGFVKVAPSADPDTGDVGNMDTNAVAQKFTAPPGATTVTEIGWWCDTATEAANYDVALYTDNSEIGEAQFVVGSISANNAKGTTAGWKTVTGLNIPVVAGTDYWIAVQLDDTATATKFDEEAATGNRNVLFSATALTDPWGSSDVVNSFNSAFYAKYDTTTRINIGDVWKNIEAIKINIGDSWKVVSGMQINSNGSEWSTVF